MYGFPWGMLGERDLGTWGPGDLGAGPTTTGPLSGHWKTSGNNGNGAGNAPQTAQDGHQTAHGHGEGWRYPDKDPAKDPDKDRRTRPAVLNTAATVLAHNLSSKPITAEDLEALAERLERWVYRPLAQE